MNILVTGGAGYIGSHTVVELLGSGHTVVVVDNLANSSLESIKRTEEITGKNVIFYQLDIRDKSALKNVFSTNTIDAVIHFAGLKAVGESTKKPLDYYDTNVYGSIVLIEVMAECGVQKLIFSSSATVYGEPGVTKYTEDLPAGQNISSPYGKTKYIIEQIIADTAAANPDFHATILRYFNPIGAHESGKIGEDPSGIPNNLMPFIAQVATGKRDKLSIFGNDYDTPDGTCLRDYIHAVDLAKGHIAALAHLTAGIHTYNLGSGKATSVLELVRAFERASGVPIAFEFAPRRAGDLPEYYADASKATKELNWRTEKSIADMCRDTWNWQSQNPNGYAQ